MCCSTRGRAALAVALSACVSTSALAGFTVSATKVDQGATDVVSVYLFNDGLNNSGTALEAYELYYSGSPVRFNTYPPLVDEPDEPPVPDIFNTTNHSGFSWFRAHPQLHRPFMVIPALADPAWLAPISDFRVTYATFSLEPMPADVGRGYKVAQLQIADGGDFHLWGKAGGESGGSALVSVDFPYYIPNIPPQIQKAEAAAGSESPLSLVSALDTDGVITSFTVADLDNAAAMGVRVSSMGGGYLVDTSGALPGTYRLQFTATDSSVQSNNSSSAVYSFAVLAPEPASACLLAASVLLAGRRRR